MESGYCVEDTVVIDDNEAQVAEKVCPVCVMGQDAGVQHVGVGENNIGILADGRTVGLRSVAVIDGGF